MRPGDQPSHPDDPLLDPGTPRRRVHRVLQSGALLAAGVSLGLLLAWPTPSTRGHSPGPILEEVLRLLDERFVRPVDTEELFHEGLDEMLRGLDHNTRYISPRKTLGFEADTEGFFVGIGIVLRRARDSMPPVIRSVLPGSPAAEAELAAGDEIISVDGVSYHDIEEGRINQRIQGPPGTHVNLGLRRSGHGEFERPVQRRRVTLPSVRGVRLYRGPASAVGYVRLEQFQTGSAEEVRRALRSLRDAGATAFILDLRDNPGGVLSESLDICDLFLDAGITLTTRGRPGHIPATVYRAKPGAEFSGARLVIAIDNGSASASEVVAAALQDHRAAVLVGSESFGKWTVQDVIELNGTRDGILKITSKTHHPPVGRWVHRDERGHRLGITPQVHVAVDAVTRAALRDAWREETLDRLGDPDAIDPRPWPSFTPPAAGEEADLFDPVLVRALAILDRQEDYAKLLATDPPAAPSGADTGAASATPPPEGERAEGGR